MTDIITFLVYTIPGIVLGIILGKILAHYIPCPGILYQDKWPDDEDDEEVEA